MGPVNWLAVVLAPCMAAAVGAIWYGPLSGTSQTIFPGHLADSRRQSRQWWWIAVVMLIASVMLGHNFARIGAETLAAKPWLYFMQSGGIAIAFVIPAVWLTYSRKAADAYERVMNSLFWLLAYLVMGATFWALG